MTIKKMKKCTVCNEDVNNVFLHIVLNTKDDKKHIQLLQPIINEILDCAENQYAFEIASNLESKYNFGDIDTLTSFVSRMIVFLGYNRRKCVASKRNKYINNIVSGDCDTVLNSYTSIVLHELIKSLPRKVKNLSPNSFPVKFRMPNNNEHKIEITKIFTFAAGHHLPNHPRLCQYSHGHEWKLEVSVFDVVNADTSMVLDFSDLKRIVKENIIDILDHNYINDILWNPTAENLCAWIFEELVTVIPSISKIKLWEAEDSFAVLTEKDFFRTTPYVLG